MRALKKIDYKINYRILPAIYFIISWVIVGFGQPAWSSFLGVLASIFGFALFWKGLGYFSSQKHRFWISLFWFMSVESIHLSWMTSTEYQGYYIYWVYLFVLFMQGLQYGLFCYFLKPNKGLPWSKIGFLASFWVILEFSRLFFICGFPFNPVGLTLTSSLLGLQNASIAGIYGLSFWVILTNLVAYKYLLDFSSKKYMFFFAVLVAAPYLYGGLHYSYHQKKIDQSKEAPIRALLVQTALTPTQKVGFRAIHEMYPPIDQWGLIYQYLADKNFPDIDIIALPERSVPLSNNTQYYDIRGVRSMISYYYGDKGLEGMPKIESERRYVDNMFLAQTLANIFKAQVIVGLEHIEEINQKNFIANASAYCFTPGHPPQMYHKRILLPLVEYTPFEWCKALARRYNIQGWYERGKDAAVFDGGIKISPSICMEEMYSYIVRGGRSLGGEIFLNITNDVWYPNSKLPKQHYYHGIVRALENGVPLMRSCNTGVTAALNSIGMPVAFFQKENNSSEWEKGALYAEIPKYHYKTLYSLWGDYFILGLSIALSLNFILQSVRVKKTILVFS